MPAKIIDGKKIANRILASLKSIKSVKSKRSPKLAIVYVGNDKPSKTYILRKREAAKKIGIDFELHKFHSKISNRQLTAELTKIQQDKSLSGLIIQLPIPKHLNTEKLINCIKPELDVDCLTSVQTHCNASLPPTPAAILEILKHLKVNLAKSKFTIIGMGKLVGGPLAEILRARGANVLTCNKNTKNTKARCRKADVLITAVGKRNLITADMVKKGAIVIDAGACFHDHKMYGDVDFEAVSKKASHITPVPGGVGPITVAMLLYNVAKRHYNFAF
jgi:methylenetetrahydrofolate dehydrogenase (NADP+)/methenyltetrahydrofolate cyclohydrolase